MEQIEIAVQLIINVMNELNTDEIELKYKDVKNKDMIFKCSLRGEV